jgi:hypothetical protein
MLRNLSESKRQKVTRGLGARGRYNNKLNNFYYSQNIIIVIESRKKNEEYM